MQYFYNHNCNTKIHQLCSVRGVNTHYITPIYQLWKYVHFFHVGGGHCSSSTSNNSGKTCVALRKKHLPHFLLISHGCVNSTACVLNPKSLGIQLIRLVSLINPPTFTNTHKPKLSLSLTHMVWTIL